MLDTNFEKIYKYFYTILTIFIILLLMFIIIPDGTELLPLSIFFDVSPGSATAVLNKPTGSEIVALVLIIIAITIWLWMYFRHKQIMKGEIPNPIDIRENHKEIEEGLERKSGGK